MGPYSVGKTTFIEYLLGRKFPGQRIGPEPTTDRFVAVMYVAARILISTDSSRSWTRRMLSPRRVLRSVVETRRID